MSRLKSLLLLPLVLVMSNLAFADEERDRLVQRLVSTVSSSTSKGVDRTGLVTNKKDEAAAVRIRKVLKNRKVTIDFDDIPVEDAMDFLRDVSGLNIVISKEARQLITDSGRNASLRLKNIRLRNALSLLLQSISDELCFGVRHGVLMIGSKTEFKGLSVSLRFYDISDILRRPPDFPAPPLGLFDNSKNP